MSLQTLSASMLPAIETELMHVSARLDLDRSHPFYEMISYHLGWSGEGSGPAAAGKRIRPLLLLLSCGACDADWQNALPAAACVELIHNFSLVHDDIQDQSKIRRGRPTVWTKWGIPQAINAGDVLFILAHLALQDLQTSYSTEVTTQANAVINQACLDLSTGQFLDISYEQHKSLSIEDYWPMVAGKTAALLSACSLVGALLGGVDIQTQESYRSFGHYLGLAFQVQDDYLGIWGDTALTGKSTASDLVAGKKSLPVLYALEKQGNFSRRWNSGPIAPDEVRSISDLLIGEGAEIYTKDIADKMTDLALQALRTANPKGEAGDALYELTNQLLNRQA
jgi:geranylgeranyl diphosphate synthase type I